MIPVRVPPGLRPYVVRAGITVAADHPLANDLCPCCDEPLRLCPVSLVYVGRHPDDHGRWTAAAVAVHDDCAAPPPALTTEEAPHAQP